MDLYAINGITFFDKKVKCQKCLYYKIIKHLNEKYQYADGEFKRINIEGSADCHLLEQIFSGIKLINKDYKKMKACKVFVEKLVWEGVTAEFVKGIGSIVNYIFLASNVRVGVDDIFQVIETIEEKQFNIGEALISEDINEQFREEMLNYTLFEKVRKRVVVDES